MIIKAEYTDAEENDRSQLTPPGARFTHLEPTADRQVAWIKSENQGILSLNDKVISDHARLSVVRNDVNTWTMTLRGVRRDDSGSYMCQVNTSPVRAQVSRIAERRVISSGQIRLYRIAPSHRGTAYLSVIPQH